MTMYVMCVFPHFPLQNNTLRNYLEDNFFQSITDQLG